MTADLACGRCGMQLAKKDEPCRLCYPRCYYCGIPQGSRPHLQGCPKPEDTRKAMAAANEAANAPLPDDVGDSWVNMDAERVRALFLDTISVGQAMRMQPSELVDAYMRVHKCTAAQVIERLQKL